jgi:hypothetical protein
VEINTYRSTGALVEHPDACPRQADAGTSASCSGSTGRGGASGSATRPAIGSRAE